MANKVLESRPVTREGPTPDDNALEQLLAAAREGDQEAIGEMYDAYSPRIYGYLIRRTGDPALADDLTGQVFLKVLKAIKAGRPWRSSFTGWLYRIAHNVLSDHRRSRDRRPECALPDTLPESDGEVLDDQADKGVALGLVKCALEELRSDYADVIRLRFNEGLPHAAVAAQLGKTEGAVKVAQHRALKMLRAELEAHIAKAPAAA